MLRDRSVAQENSRYKEWLAMFDKFGVQFLVLDARRDSGLLQAVRSNPEWIVDFKDREAVLLARSCQAAVAEGKQG